MKHNAHSILTFSATIKSLNPAGGKKTDKKRLNREVKSATQLVIILITNITIHHFLDCEWKSTDHYTIRGIQHRIESAGSSHCNDQSNQKVRIKAVFFLEGVPFFNYVLW